MTLTAPFVIALIVASVWAATADHRTGYGAGSGPRGWGLLVGVMAAGIYITLRAP